MQATTNQKLNEIKVEFMDKSAACVIMASGGYPESYGKGYEITIPNEILDKVYVAGASLDNGKLVTSGGRVLGVTEVASTLEKALELSYNGVKQITFEKAYYRKDIGQKALNCIKGNN